MIERVLPPIVSELNNFFKSKHNITEDKVVLSPLVNADGTMAVQEVDKIVLTVANIDWERTKSSTGKYSRMENGNFTKRNAPINVAVYLLFSAYFTPENYLEGLKFISSTMAFFQSRGGSFTPQNTPQLRGVLDKVYAELIPLDFRDLGSVWGGLGAKYMPSALYKLRTIPIEHFVHSQGIPSIKQT